MPLILTSDQIAAATADRFERWGRFLREHSATPIMMISLRVDAQPVITTVEDMDDDTAIELLKGILRVLRSGRAERLARPPGETGTTDRYTMEATPP